MLLWEQPQQGLRPQPLLPRAGGLHPRRAEAVRRERTGLQDDHREARQPREDGRRKDEGREGRRPRLPPGRAGTRFNKNQF